MFYSRIMFILSLLFLWSCTNLLIRRSENCEISWSILLTQNNYKFLYFIIIFFIFYIYWIQPQMMSILLLISGIERNPGPKSRNVTLSKIYIDKGHGICDIKHTCDVKGCDIEIFASCHCDSCEVWTTALLQSFH